MNLSDLRIFIFFTVFLFSHCLTAGNYDSNLLSGSASLSGGSQVSLAEDGGALWYNPAGLGLINRKEFSLSGNGFMLRIRNNPGFMKTVVGEDIDKTATSSREIFVIASSVIMARSLTENIGVAAGMFVPNMDRYDYYLSHNGSQNDVNYKTAMGLKSDIDQFYYGFGLGWRIAPSISAGFNLFGYYSMATYEFETTSVFRTIDPDDLYFNHVRVTGSQEIHGLMGSLGLKWDFLANWHLGFRISSPLLGIIIRNENKDEASIGIKGFDSNPDSGYNMVEGKTKEHGKLVIPMNAVLGLGYSSGKGSVSAEIQFHAPMEFKNGSKKEFVINARAGGSFQITDTISMGAGVFTDFSPEKRTGDEASYIDFFGVTLGGKYISSYALVENPKKDAIVFGTIVSLRYALGLGEFNSVTFNPLTENLDNLVTVGNHKADFHEISLHISTELYFW